MISQDMQYRKKSNQQDIRINRNDFNKRINSRYIQVWLDANVTGQSCKLVRFQTNAAILRKF